MKNHQIKEKTPVGTEVITTTIAPYIDDSQVIRDALNQNVVAWAQLERRVDQIAQGTKLTSEERANIRYSLTHCLRCNEPISECTHGE